MAIEVSTAKLNTIITSDASKSKTVNLLYLKQIPAMMPGYCLSLHVTIKMLLLKLKEL